MTQSDCPCPTVQVQSMALTHVWTLHNARFCQSLSSQVLPLSLSHTHCVSLARSLPPTLYYVSLT